jgi:eukaryotic-like serine/threonine-protein kinase
MRRLGLLRDSTPPAPQTATRCWRRNRHGVLDRLSRSVASSAGPRPDLTMPYRERKPIGAGSFGNVVQADEVDAEGRLIRKGLAIKRLRPVARRDDEDVARFRREAALMRGLSHPHIVEIVHADLESDDPFFVMPLAERTLEREIRRPRAPFAAREAWAREVFEAVCAGVAHAHAHDIIHRDLKPENVLFVNGVVKVADFGLGKDLSSDSLALTKSDAELGTPLYRAPEQVRGRSAGKPADVFALGKMLAEMLTGVEPMLGAPDLHAVPYRYRAFVGRCCASDPDSRYPDAGAALAEFPGGDG